MRADAAVAGGRCFLTGVGSRARMLSDDRATATGSARLMVEARADLAALVRRRIDLIDHVVRM
jgi:hypothetical protein